MEQETDIIKQLKAFIAAPENISREDIPVLRELSTLYPYFQPLHLLRAKAEDQEETAGNALAHAALYAEGQLLHNFLHAPEALISNEFELVLPVSFGTDPNQPEALDEAAIDEVQETVAEEEELKAEISGKEKLEDELVLENIVATDFFAFQENFKVEPAVTEESAPVEEAEAEEKIISKYDDDKLPYTFLWWLAKTRKEHQQIFQPYASPRKQTVQQGSTVAGKPNELQQQYVEHIFHMQSPFQEEDNSYTPSQFKRASKGDEIIESFIRNEPQISPPNPEQINTENKAKKSAEDHNDLVSETLAKIYIEQMLYDKAIETYEKLVLKFPEKSRYFADLIQSIEKKI